MIIISYFRCTNCNTIFQDETSDICPKCSSKNTEYYLYLNDRIIYHDNMKGKQGKISNKISGRKRPASEFQTGEEKSISSNKWVKKIRIINRVKNLYYEKVVDLKTKIVIHECNEPLSKHTGHGSAKK